MALNEVTWSADGGLIGILGRNGAGKTTMLRIIVSLLHPTSGKVTVDGFDTVRDASAVRRRVGYLPQDFQPYPELSVREFLEYIGALAGLRGAALRRNLEHVVELTNLSGFVRARTSTLSGGTRRRLGVAQALLGEPQLLVVDEPTAGLDPEERVRLRQVLAGLGHQMTILLSTHVAEDIQALASRLIVLDRGHLVFDGTPAELINRARGHVYETESDQAAGDSPDAVVSRATPVGDRFQLRVVSGRSPVNGSLVEPSLEDAYLSLMQAGDPAS